MAIDLSSYEQAFSQAVITEGGGSDEPPDGEYDVAVERAEVKLSKTSGKPMLSWQYRIEGPSQAGRCLFRHDVFTADAEKMGRLLSDLHVCGLKLERFQDIEARAGELVGVRLRVKKRTKGEFTDVFINGRLGDAIDPSAPF
jgi:hypothetical protein